MAKIIAPNQKFTGKRAGVAFVDGKADTDDESAIRYFATHGYKVEGKAKKAAPKPPPAKPEDPATDPLAGLNVEELRAHAAENDIDLGGARTKAEIRDAIAAAAPVADSPADA
jgi:hypothetical protein